MRDGILDISDPFDMHALHVVYLPMVQCACDDFVDMWNSHRIRGQLTHHGFGGGIPDRLWCDDVASETAMLDDHTYFSQGAESYGVDEPHTGDTEDLPFAERLALDPLALWPQLQLLRCEFLHSIGGGSQLDDSIVGGHGITEYLAYRHTSHELRVAALEHPGTPVVDWAAFCSEPSLCEYSNRHQLRRWLASAALELRSAGHDI